MAETNSVAVALSRVAATSQSAGQAAACARKNLEAEYPRLLVRSHEPKKGDDERIGEIIVALGLDPSRVARDGEIVAKAREHLARVATDAEVSEAHTAAAQSHEALIKRHRKELEEADRQLYLASLNKRRVNDSKAALRSLLKERPELFGCGLLEIPPGVATLPPTPATKAPPENTRQVFTMNIGSKFEPHWVEPVVNDDGSYVRDRAGNYLLPDGHYYGQGCRKLEQPVV